MQLITLALGTFKEKRCQLKRYGALFTCMASRAIHLEVANYLTMDTFINAYHRFVGRRGPVRQMRSEQGTNFVGARNELQQALSGLRPHQNQIGDAEEKLRLDRLQNESTPCKPHGRVMRTPNPNCEKSVGSLVESPWVAA